MGPTTKPVPKAGAMVSVVHNNALHALAAQVLGHAPGARVKVQAAHHVAIHRAIAVRHQDVMPQPRVHAHRTAPPARSEPAQAWVLEHVRGRVPVRQAGQPHVAPVATRLIAHVVRLCSTSNLHAHRLAAPACKIHHHEYSN